MRRWLVSQISHTVTGCAFTPTLKRKKKTVFTEQRLFGRSLSSPPNKRLRRNRVRVGIVSLSRERHFKQRPFTA